MEVFTFHIVEHQIHSMEYGVPQYGISNSTKMKKVQKCTGIHDHSSTHVPELSRVGQDVLTIVILTLHLLWRELSLEINSLSYLPTLYLHLRTICVELVLTNRL